MADIPPRPDFNAAEIGALAHLYRAEVYRSTVWRTRLDTTTNWSVVTLGVALSITFASTEASPLPLVLVGVLIMLFLTLEARRYRYFNVWRARARWLETHFYAPMLRDGDLRTAENWGLVLARDYMAPRYHIPFHIAVGRRIQRSYLWILCIQSIAYVGKLVVHPTPVTGLDQFLDRAAVGPVPGWVMALGGLVYILAWTGLALYTARADYRKHRGRGGTAAMG
jgi:uncharacterized membrane protein